MQDLREKVRLMPHDRDLANADSYSFLWFARAYFLGEVSMRSGKKCLKFSKNLSLSVFEQGFPDQCSWVRTLGCYFKVDTLGALASKLQYKRPVEFLCMDTCIFGDSSLHKYSAGDLKRLAPRIKRKRRELKQTNGGWESHPSVVLKAVDEDDEDLMQDSKRLKKNKK